MPFQEGQANIRDLPTRMTASDDDDIWGRKVDLGGFSAEMADEFMRVYGTSRRPHAVDGTLLRASMAGNCLRQLYYYGCGYDPSDPPTPADLYRMNVGSILHEFLQSESVWGPKAEFEKAFHLPAISLSGSTDIWYEDTKTLVELKSAGGYKFKKIGVFNNAEGPSDNNLRQVALAARALKAEVIVIIYIGLETVNRGDTDRYGLTDQGRWLAEFVYSMDDLDELADDEINRQSVVMRSIIDREPPSRHIPGMPEGAAINKSNPNSGKATWTLLQDGVVADTGTHWACDYCQYQKQCQDDLNAGM